MCVCKQVTLCHSDYGQNQGDFHDDADTDSDPTDGDSTTSFDAATLVAAAANDDNITHKHLLRQVSIAPIDFVYLCASVCVCAHDHISNYHHHNIHYHPCHDLSALHPSLQTENHEYIHSYVRGGRGRWG